MLIMRIFFRCGGKKKRVLVENYPATPVEGRRREDERSSCGKLLLLGVGNAGKSTVAKQLVNFYGYPPKIKERKMYKVTIHQHIICRLKLLILQYQKLNPDQRNFRLDEMCVTILSHDNYCRIDEQLAQLISDTWSILSTSSVGIVLASFADLKHFVQNLDRVIHHDYAPTLHDLNFVRVPTLGVKTEKISFKGQAIDVYDAGGQRCERRKWIHYFDDVNTIVFVVPIDQYDLFSDSDPFQNRLVESIELFTEICNNDHLCNADLIILFNKIDVFEEKIKKVDLQSVPEFKDFSGPKHNMNLALDYIKSLFLRCKQKYSRSIYCHVTCGIDPDCMRIVGGIVLENILTQFFFAAGLPEANPLQESQIVNVRRSFMLNGREVIL